MWGNGTLGIDTKIEENYSFRCVRSKGVITIII